MKRLVMSEMTSRELRAAVDAGTDTAIIPAASTEVLGAYGPLGCDTFVADAVSRRLGEATGCLVAPVIPVGDALELRFWPGTITVEPDTLRALYLDVCSSLVRDGVKRLVFLNTHMMNMRAVDACGRTLRSRGVPVAQAMWWQAAFAASQGIAGPSEHATGHGGEVIASVIMALRPDLLDPSGLARAEWQSPKEALRFHGRYTATAGGPFFTYPDFSDFCDLGAWGDPRGATAEMGKAIVERALASIASFVSDFRAQPLPAARG
jgi:creatinine amidohydrolase